MAIKLDATEKGLLQQLRSKDSTQMAFALSSHKLTQRVILAALTYSSLWAIPRSKKSKIVPELIKLASHRLMTPEATEKAFFEIRTNDSKLSATNISTIYLIMSDKATVDMFDAVLTEERYRMTSYGVLMVRKALANPKCPSYYLNKHLGNAQFNTTVIKNPSLDQDTLRQLYTSGNNLEPWVVQNINCPPDLIREFLTNNTGKLIRKNNTKDAMYYTILRNPRMPQDVVELYIDDGNTDIFRNPNVRPQVIRNYYERYKISADGGDNKNTIAAHVINGANCPPDILLDYMFYHDLNIKLAVVKHPNADAKVLFLGTLAEHPRIVACALLNANAPQYLRQLTAID